MRQVMKSFSWALGCVLVVGVAFGASGARATEIIPGVENLAQYHAKELAGKRVAILTNPTGVGLDFTSTIDLVRALPNVTVVRLFSPEHGLRGGYSAGQKVDETKDPVSGLPIVSLYGKSRRPSQESLKGLDVVLYDIQDVGVRHYTFVSSLTYMMEECEKAGVEVWVLDRPDPMGGMIVGGPMLEDDLKSFIGIHNVPLIYGMTPGEWARMIQAERTPKVHLKIIPVRGWTRGMTYGQIGWPWVPPSPNIPRWESCIHYAMTGTIGETGKVSEGVGTPLPFELIGAPWLDGARFAKGLTALQLPGVAFRAASFTPRFGAFSGQTCNGAQMYVTDTKAVDPARVQLELMAALNRLAADKAIFKSGRKGQEGDSLFLKALGDKALGATLADAQDPHAHDKRINEQIEAFMKRRAKYLIYDEPKD